MRTSFYRHYFIIVKLIGLLFFLGDCLLVTDENLNQICIHFLVGALFILAAVLLELSEEWRKAFGMWIGEGILAVTAVFLFPVTGMIFLSIFLLDGISIVHGKIYGYLLPYVMLPVCYRFGVGMRETFWMLTLLILFYIQEKVVAAHYRGTIQENEETEGKLKTTMERADQKHHRELQKSHLQLENQVLEERGRLSQALHDKLGHSINGSVFKLEAAKLLVEKKPEESLAAIQEVIDNLRESMNEIRMILRKEKPDKKRMALLSIQSLCEECEEKYHIHTELNIGDGSNLIPENVWEIILDNTFEAVTNALKYSECTNLYIDIIPMNQIVRCTIRDDGKGAENVEDGMGLEGMRKRVRSIQGFLDVETELGVGFSINMILPIK